MTSRPPTAQAHGEYAQAHPGQPRQPRPPLTKRMRPGHWMAIDFTVASFLALLCLIRGTHSGSPGQLPGTLVFSGVIFLAVGLRRRGPLAAFGVLGLVVAIGAMSPSGGIDSVAFVAMAFVLYVVTVTSSRLAGFLALAVGLAEIATIAIAIHYQQIADAQLPSTAGTFGMIIAWMTGYSVRQRRAYVEMMQAQAASSAVAEERLRIARELHDVVAHSMSVIAVQAGFGQYVIDTSPADAREALGAISVTSREALTELRRMLGVLRQEGALSSAPLTPECGLAELSRLVERTRGAGIDVRLTRAGTARELPAGIDVSAYRIIQESLTNVVKHAGGGARCAVSVRFDLDELAIEVRNTASQGGFAAPSTPFRGEDPPDTPLPGGTRHNPPGPRASHLPGWGQAASALDPRASHLPGWGQAASALDPRASHLPGWGQAASALDPRASHLPGLGWHGAGHGIVGMRERVHLCGGALSVGPLPEGGFRVLARLPIPVTAPLVTPAPQSMPAPQSTEAPRTLELVP